VTPVRCSRLDVRGPAGHDPDLAGSTGALALALLARRGNGATDTLLAAGGLTHAELLLRVQDDVLGSRLDRLGTVIPAAEQ
jgi:hypothetical protein